jgi:hypothetical protein
MSLCLHDDRPIGHAITVAVIPDSQLDEVAGTQFAVDAQIEQREFPFAMTQLQVHANSPDLLQLKWRLLANNDALVPGFTM